MNYTPHKITTTPLPALHTLVENRKIFNGSHFELNIFETYQAAEKVTLTFSDLVLTSMIRGKKVMNLPQKKEFDYLPGESVIVPAGETMVIDFPEANLYNPTQCIALAIDEKKIADLLHHLNDKFPKVERNDTWQIDEKYFHLKNNWEIKENIDRMVNIIRSGNILKDMLAEVTLKELLIRIMQTQARNFIFENYQKLHTNHRMAYVIQYIKDNIHQNLSIDDLSKQACMSKSHFFRSFKQEFGISPIDYILQERIERAKFLLKNSAQSIAQISYEVGFSSPAYFNRMFKKITNETPQHYKKK